MSLVESPARQFDLEKPTYEFKQVKFNVDDILGEHIKEPFPNKSFFWCVVGKAGSGKTSLVINALRAKKENRVYRKVFDKIVLVMPKNSRASLKDNPLDDLPSDQVFDSMGPDVISKIEEIREDFDEQNKKKKRSRRQLLIMDDVTAYLKDNTQTLVELATNRRHLKLSIILLVQYLRSIPRPVRLQVTHLTFFKPSNELELKTVYEEFINMDKHKFEELTRFIFNEPHDFIFIDKDYNKYFKNLQKINI
jgi:hypothetical protein